MAAVAPGDLMNAQKIGEELYQTFKREHLEKTAADPDRVDFFVTMKKQQLKTFGDMCKKKVKCKGKELMLRADRILFGHMIVVAQTIQLDLKDVLSHLLGPIPWALAEGDGSLRKTDKAKLMKNVADAVPVVESFSGRSACVINGMSIVQKLDGNQWTFHDVAKTLLKRVLQEAGKSDRVDIVFDVYRDVSIKDAERVGLVSDSIILL